MVALACSNSTMLYVCTRCYGYTSGGQFKKLRKQCVPEVQGRLSKYAAAVVSYLKRGLHPKTAGVTCEFFNPEVAEDEATLQNVAAALRRVEASTEVCDDVELEEGSD